MKTILVVISSILVGLFAGSGFTVLSLRDPGPDFDWMEKPLTVGSISTSSDNDQVPSIDLPDGDEYDFGVMDRGETRTHTFIIQNNTLDPIYPEVTGTTCKCTVGELEDDTIPPGGEGKVTLEWVAKSLDTEFRQSATIGTQNAVRPDIVLSVFGRVIQMVSVKPRNISFSDVRVRDSRTAEFAVFAFKDDRLTVTEEKWVNEEIADFFEFSWETAPAEVVAEEEDALSAILCKLTMKPGLPLGQVQQVLELKTSSSDAGVVDVPIIARIVGDVSVNGSNFQDATNTLRLGPVQKSKGVTSKIHFTIKGEYAKDFSIDDVRVDPANVLEVAVADKKSLNNGRVVMVPIEISIPAGADAVNYSGGKGHPKGEIVFKTNHPDVNDLTINVVFAVVE